MNTGKTRFAQLMDFLPWITFSRIVSRYDGDRAVLTLSSVAQFRVMAFAQLTYWESLRDIKACLSAQAGKLYRDRVHHSTLAGANEACDWRIYVEFAQRLISRARRLYAGDDLGVDLGNTVATARASSMPPTASCATFTRSTCGCRRLVPSM